MYVKNLKKITINNIKEAGGKGASLGEMMRVKILVPHGFIILTSAFERFLEEKDLNVEINAIFNSVDCKKIHSVEGAAEKIKALIFHAEIPNIIAHEIERSFQTLKSKFVAVRSSATAEDSVNAAWAGQLDTYLNTTKKDLLKNVKKCWASLFTPRAIFYCFDKKMQKQKISVAVVVQKMIQSEVSGIAFSVHPATQDKNQMVIEAGFGLGEAIVSGQITPDSYVVEKNTRKILDKNISKQRKLITRSRAGNNEWQIILRKKQEQQKLSNKEILNLAKLIMKIESHYGFPVDVEWAKEQSRFYIVQSRPITTLPNINIIENNQSIFNYIKSQAWFFGVRADESLLFYSARRNSYIEYIKKEYGVEFAETMLVPLKRNYPIRVFNLQQAKEFHAISKKKILKNPQILISYVKKNNLLYREIEAYSKKLIATAKRSDYLRSIWLFNKILSLYEIANAQFIIIFSLGLKLVENKNKLKNIKGIIREHDIWRNGVAFKEEAMGKSLICFFKFLTKRKKLRFDPLFLMKFLTLNEVEAWLNKKLTDVEIKRVIKLRKECGFIYLNLRNKKQEIITEPTEIMKIQKYFLKLDKESKKTKSDDEITGQVAYGLNKILKGVVIVIKDRLELKNKNHLIAGKILVAIQTTPHYIPYIKGVKAIITDEGGLTCHAAIVAREFKKPCIVGTKIATQIFKTGDFVEINTNKGIIRKIKM